MIDRIEVFGESKEEKVVLRLKLKPQSSGNVMLCAVDDRGDTVMQGNILEITKSGRVISMLGISSKLGLKLTPSGALVDVAA